MRAMVIGLLRLELLGYALSSLCTRALACGSTGIQTWQNDDIYSDSSIGLDPYQDIDSGVASLLGISKATNRHFSPAQSCEALTAFTVKRDIHDKPEATHVAYNLRSQIWDQDNHHWAEFNPAKPVATAANDKPSTYFTVTQRYKNVWSDPEILISDWSAPLLSFLRAAAGDDFFQENPIVPMDSLLPETKQLRRKYTLIKELVTDKHKLNIIGEQELRDLGCLDAEERSASRKMCEAYLSELVVPLKPFMSHLNEQFAPIERQLARMREYGQMDFALLPYYFERGQKVFYYDENSGRPTAFVLESRHVERTGWNGKAMLELNGFAWRFDGSKYSKRRVYKEIDEFKGTRSIDDLPVMELSESMERMLEDRGRLYTSLAGVHHKEYEGQRIILDPKAYHSRSGYGREPEVTVEVLDDERLFLLPPHMEGFNLANKVCPECQRLRRPCPAETCRTWQRFDVTKVNDVVFDDHAWDHLVLDTDTKDLLEALVRITDNNNTQRSIMSDVISGKGGGLIAVLHGPPGTGKTLTAESIAEYLHRPIYVVGFSELSTTPEGLEQNLRSILSLATAWDAVVLIDEADVFLEQRSLEQIERNALVSVALRLLEYHRGVLFLTTNRITTFDQAFISRFSIAIKYEELDYEGRLVVWRKFLELARSGSPAADSPMANTEQAEMTMDDLSDLANKPFNGRMIKNLVRTAQALAVSRREHLSLDHIKTVVRVQEKFFQEFGNTAVGHRHV